MNEGEGVPLQRNETQLRQLNRYRFEVRKITIPDVREPSNFFPNQGGFPPQMRLDKNSMA